MTYETSDKFAGLAGFYTTLFEALPGCCILLQNDAPRYTILAANPEYISQTGTTKAYLIGKGIFEAFPPNPDNPTDTGIDDVRASLDHVRLQKEPHRLPVQRYDVAGEDGVITERHRSVVNKPVFSPEGAVAYIIHAAEDITTSVKAEKRELQIEGIEKFFDLFMHAPMVVGMADGDDYVLEMANQEALKLWGKGPEIIGKPILQGLPELEGQSIIDLFNEVRSSGKPYIAHEVPVTSFANGREEQHYFNLVYQPYYSKNNIKATGIFTISHDVTEQVKARQKALESEEKYRNLFESMDQGYCTLEIIFDGNQCVDCRYLETNPSFERHLGMTNALGKTIREIAPDIEPKWFGFYGNVALTGIPIRIEEESTAFNKWFEVYAIRLGSAAERKVGVFFTDITNRKTSELLLKNNQALLQTIFDAAPNSLTVYKAIYNQEGHIEDFEFVIVNEFTIQTTGRHDLIGKCYGAEFPHVKETGVMDVFKKVATTGIPEDFEKWYEGEGMRHWFRFIINKVGQLLLVTVEDITKRKEAERKILDSEQYSRSLFYNSPVAVLVCVGPNMVLREANEKMLTIFGRGNEIIGQPIMKAIPELATTPLMDQYRNVLQTGITHHQQAEKILLVKNGQPYWGYYDYTYKPLYNTGGIIYGVICTAIEVTEQVIARQKLEEKETALEAALEQVRLSKEAADLGTFDLDLERDYMHWDNRCRTLFGISHQNKVTYEKDFVEGLHPEDKERILKIIDLSFDKSVSNGNYDVEYRTVGAEDGKVRWVRAKGKVYFNTAEKPVRFIGSVLDITEQVTAFQKIENLVEERTKELAQANGTLQTINTELQRSNAHLEEFAHAASHDLKEPVRKIHFFTHQLKQQLSGQLKEEQTRAFNRIENATERMGALIDDLLLYSHVSQRPHEMESINLNDKLQRVLEDLELDIEEKKAIVNVSELPVVQGYRRQLQQVFQNLISNALKYSRAGVPPVILITANEVTENGVAYHAIAVQDNGIGFEQQYAGRIFQMFTRLHGKAEYSGTGVGLSIVKKVVENHNGIIKVDSTPGEGSTFRVLLPA